MYILYICRIDHGYLRFCWRQVWLCPICLYQLKNWPPLVSSFLCGGGVLDDVTTTCLSDWVINHLGLRVGGEGERDQIGMNKGGAEHWSIPLIDSLDVKMSVPRGCYITSHRYSLTHDVNGPIRWGLCQHGRNTCLELVSLLLPEHRWISCHDAHACTRVGLPCAWDITWTEIQFVEREKKKKDYC